MPSTQEALLGKAPVHGSEIKNATPLIKSGESVLLKMDVTSNGRRSPINKFSMLYSKAGWYERCCCNHKRLSLQPRLAYSP